MLTKFQCKFCLHAIGLPDRHVGRKILCPMCGDPMVVPEPDPSRTFRKQNLREVIKKFQLSEWDKAFAAQLLVDKTIGDADLKKAIASVIGKSRKGPAVSLGEELQKEGLITGEERSRLRELVRGSVSAEKTELIECPNCFANIDAKSRACKFCGQSVGDTSQAICPNCKHEQPRGIAHCRRCRADMKTGLRPNQKRCPACNEPVNEDDRKCPHCKAIIKKLAGGRGQLAAEKQARAKRNLLMGAVGSVLILILCILLYRPVADVLRIVTVGSSQASLERRIRHFRDALDENSLSQIEGYLPPDSTIRIERDTRDIILCGKRRRGMLVKSLKDLEIADVEMAEDEKSATTKIKARVLMQGDQRSLGIDAGPSHGLQVETFEVEWKWVCAKDEWCLTAPLPAPPKPQAKPASEDD